MTAYSLTYRDQDPQIWTALSADTPPTPSIESGQTVAGPVLYETNTKNKYEWNGAGWVQTHSGGVLITTDFYTEVSKGSISGQSIVHKFGRNDAVPNGSWEFVNNLGFTAWPLSAATTVRIKAGGNAADTAASGAGAREITVQGIDSNGDESTEVILTAGASASSATTASFWRVHRAWVSSCGTYGAANTGSITIENSSGGTDLIQIAADEGQSQFAGFTIPSGKTGYLINLNINVDATKSADIRVMTREDITDAVAPMSSKRVKLYFDGVLGSMTNSPKGSEFSIPELSDIWIEARGAGAGTEVSASFELLLVDD